MGTSALYEAAATSLLVAAKLSAPLVIAALVVGVVVSFVQSLFQINEPTLTFVPKVLAVGLVLLAMAAYMGTTLVDLFHYALRLATSP